MEAIHNNNINQLPTELLVRIFLLAQTPSQRDTYLHLRLSSVCRYWRKVINDYGIFWSVIYFSPWKGERPIRESVARSGSVNLSVFSPFDCDRAKIGEIVATFDNLLQTEGHRIKFLYIMEDFHCILPKAVSGKALPILKTLIFRESTSFTQELELFAIIKAAKGLKNLNTYLPRSSTGMSSLLSELKPTFERLINLKLKSICPEIKKQIFMSILPSCSKLESLTVSSSLNYQDAIHFPSLITLANLISLDVDCYSLFHKLCAPKLRNLRLSDSRRLQPDQHDYLIFDEYDLSPVTQLVVRGSLILVPELSSVFVKGFTGSKSYYEDPWTSFEMAQYMNYTYIDLRRDDLDILVSSIPTQFYIESSPYDTSMDDVASSDLKPFPVLSKIFSQLHNLERLDVTPFDSLRTISPLSISNLEAFETFLKIIFDNLVSSKIKWLAIRKIEMNANILRLIFNLVNNCSSLSNLDTVELTISRNSRWDSNDVSLNAFAEELVNSLRLRQKAGYRALSRLEMDLGDPLPEKYIAEVAILGTQVMEIASRSDIISSFTITS